MKITSLTATVCWDKGNPSWASSTMHYTMQAVLLAVHKIKACGGMCTCFQAIYSSLMHWKLHMECIWTHEGASLRWHRNHYSWFTLDNSANSQYCVAKNAIHTKASYTGMMMRQNYTISVQSPCAFVKLTHLFHDTWCLSCNHDPNTFHAIMLKSSNCTLQPISTQALHAIKWACQINTCTCPKFAVSELAQQCAWLHTWEPSLHS